MIEAAPGCDDVDSGLLIFSAPDKYPLLTYDGVYNQSLLKSPDVLLHHVTIHESHHCRIRLGSPPKDGSSVYKMSIGTPTLRRNVGGEKPSLLNKVRDF